MTWRCSGPVRNLRLSRVEPDSDALATRFSTSVARPIEGAWPARSAFLVVGHRCSTHLPIDFDKRTSNIYLESVMKRLIPCCCLSVCLTVCLFVGLTLSPSTSATLSAQVVGSRMIAPTTSVVETVPEQRTLSPLSLQSTSRRQWREGGALQLLPQQPVPSRSTTTMEAPSPAISHPLTLPAANLTAANQPTALVAPASPLPQSGQRIANVPTDVYSFRRDGLPTLEQRRQLREMPIESRPYRPLHFYGNTVRRRIAQ